MATPPLLLDEPHGDASGGGGGGGRKQAEQAALETTPPVVKTSRLQKGLSVSAGPRLLASRTSN